MSKNAVIILLFLSTLVGVFGDSIIKNASEKYSNGAWRLNLVLGLLIYIGLALLWFYYSKHVKLTTVGVIYPIFSMILYTLSGIIYFKERVNIYEIIGIFLGMTSVYILTRYS